LAQGKRLLSNYPYYIGKASLLQEFGKILYIAQTCAILRRPFCYEKQKKDIPFRRKMDYNVKYTDWNKSTSVESDENISQKGG